MGQHASNSGLKPRLSFPSRRRENGPEDDLSTVIATTSTPFTVEWNATLKQKEMVFLTTMTTKTTQSDDDEDDEDKNTIQGQVSITVGDIQVSREVVQLCAKTIVELMPGVGALRQCKELVVCCNQLTTLPMKLGLLTQLKSLSLSYNHLRQVPECIGSLVWLEVLKLDHNRLIALPDSLGRLKRLRLLHLQDNRIMELSSTVIAGLESITELDISRNPIRVLPAEIRNLRLLRRFHAVDCSFVTTSTTQAQPYPRHVHVPSLKELCARALWPAYMAAASGTRKYATTTTTTTTTTAGPVARLPAQLQHYLRRAKRCSHCDRPWFETHVVRANVIARGGRQYPIVYRLCSAHWFTERERIRLLFQVQPSARDTVAPSLPQPKKAFHLLRHIRWRL